MNSCIHCMGVKKNEIGETVVLCEHFGRWENVTLGSCFRNCEAQEFSRDYKEALSFAISMLSDCEPKVLTLKELKEIGDDKPIYLETTLGEVHLKPAIYQPDCSDDEYACVVSAWCKSGFYAWNNYNADWRCWSNKPSDEQMEATPWEA